MIDDINNFFVGKKLLQVEQIRNHIVRLHFEDDTGIQIIGGCLCLSYINHAAVLKKLRELEVNEVATKIVDYIDWID